MKFTPKDEQLTLQMDGRKINTVLKDVNTSSIRSQVHTQHI